MNIDIKEVHELSWLNSENFIFLEEQYKKFLLNSENLDEEWKNIFTNFNKKEIKSLKNFATYKEKLDILKKNKNKNKNFNVHYTNFLKFLENIRIFGHYYANLDPLKIKKKNIFYDLELSNFSLSEKDLQNIIQKDFLHFKKHKNTLQNILNFFKEIYCKNIGFEYMHLKNYLEREWIKQKIEDKNFINFSSVITQKKILIDLIKAKNFEKFLNSKFTGSKRFSVEGIETIIPLLNYLINISFKNNISHIVLGMPHRGRINILINVLKDNLKLMLKKFLGKHKFSYGSGDVKYHIGAFNIFNKNNKKIKINLLNNPSHLEIISPVVLGYCRSLKNSKKNEKNVNVLPLLIHGDASFSGQGVIQEILNMSHTPGYTVDGTLHIILNNQIGFTTSSTHYLRSTIYCTDIAKMIDSPIFHVNSEDPESAIKIIKLALLFRNKFKKDVFIDLIGYRKLGHHETDDPTITQPIMYEKIKQHDSITKKYFKKVLKNKIIKKNFYLYEKEKYKKFLKNTYNEIFLKNNKIIEKKIESKKIKNIKKKVNKLISLNIIKNLIKIISTVPKNISLHHQIKKILENRINIINRNALIDWGTAENLAYASLIYQGIYCRITGEDVRRGTFSHRHVVFHCQKSGKKFFPFFNIHNNNKNFEIWDSTLSEEATLAFEYGYSINSKKSLIIWEAQFGDFSNGAQIVIDQFISSGQQKWNIFSSLIMYLPHGNEGQGPEHSSARLERFLQLCAQKNLKICIPTTPSQIYHMLRKHSLEEKKIPLIVFTPKSLLRNNLSFSKLENFYTQNFKKILIYKLQESYTCIKRIILCTGKIYYDLLKSLQEQNKNFILLVRFEQLYPFPYKEIKKVFILCKNVNEYFWCQEEPKNQGAWTFIFNIFQKKNFFKHNNFILKYIGRKNMASTAEGDLLNYKREQNRIIVSALSED